MNWNSLLDNAKSIADKAKAAAENLEGQLNESVGATPEILASSSWDRKNSGAADGVFRSLGRGLINAIKSEDEGDVNDDDDVFNDETGFFDDDDDFSIDMHDRNDNVQKDEEVVNEEREEEAEIINDETAIAFEFSSVAEDKENIILDGDNDVSEEPTIDNSSTAEASSDEVNASGIENEPQIAEAENKEQDDQADNPEEQDGQVNNPEEQDDQIDKNSNEVEAKNMVENSENAEEVIDFDVSKDLNGNKKIDKEVEEVNEEVVNEIEEGEREEEEEKEEEPIHDDVNDMYEDDDDDDDDLSMYEEDNHDNNDEEAIELTNQSGSHEAVIDDENIVEKNDFNPTENDAGIGNGEDSEPLLGNDETAQINGNSIQRTSSDNDLLVYVSKEEAAQWNIRNVESENLKSEIADLRQLLEQRENQVIAKAQELSAMAESHEREKSMLESKVRETKEEAKKRIGKAKEKVESMQMRLAEANAKAESVGSSSNKQQEIINALRKEGETLAIKQNKMEELVRDARGELEDVKDALAIESEAKENALNEIKDLKEQLATAKVQLSAAREGEGRADKLDSDLLAEREEREKNASKIISLEAVIKEMKVKNAETVKDMERLMNDKLTKIEAEKTTIGNEKDKILQDLEVKLRTSEREANLREDSMRHEVAELRKRWQESVRRSDALSMDLQQSSAPLMRQLESTERQSRARAAAWAELEAKLRSDLEENIIENESLNKQKYDLENEIKKLNRSIQSKDSELESAKAKIDELYNTVENTTIEMQNIAEELKETKEEFNNLKVHAKENEFRIRNELMSSMKESEEHYNDRIESLQVDIRQEREKRSLLEEKIKEINSSALLATSSSNVVSNEAPKKRSLCGKANQVDILQDTLFGLDGYDHGNENENAEEEGEIPLQQGATESFAFVEQLSQALKAANSERDSLRKQLLESEEKRSMLENECALNKDANEKLPLLEAQVAELTKQIAEKDLEMAGLREDINDVRSMYRSQLDVLLEEKASGGNGYRTTTDSSDDIKTPSRHDVVPKIGLMPHF